MRLDVRTACFLLMGLGLCGCFSNRVAWVDDSPALKGSTGGLYAIGAIPGGSITSAEIARTQGGLNVKTGPVDKGEVPAKDSALPVAIGCQEGNPKNVTGGIAMGNNFLSVCTLGVWPYVQSMESECKVTVTSPQGTASASYTVGYRTWSSFILPIAVLPCPGWGDWRSSAYMKEQESGFSEFTGATRCAVAATLLTEDFYRTEMSKYVDFLQKKFDVKKKAIERLQAVLDAE